MNLSLASLHPSPWNPRGAIDDAALAAPTQAQSARTLSLVALGTACAIDLSQTSHAIGTGRFTESNPIMRPFVDNPEAWAIVKAGSATSAIYYLHRLGKTKPKVALVATLVLVAAQVAVVAHNAREIR